MALGAYVHTHARAHAHAHIHTRTHTHMHAHTYFGGKHYAKKVLFSSFLTKLELLLQSV